MRTFEDVPATRSRVPLLTGLIGPSGVGKTFSALRLATGIQRVTGGDIFFIDTEHRRALHYADRFKFRHIDFKPPFGSLDYLESLAYCAKRNAGVVVVDSMSHEHEGPGGYLDFHEQEIQRLLKCGFRTEQSASIPAWGKPAAARSKLINGILQLGINAIFCFRAKEKVDMDAKDASGNKAVGKLGFMPIAGDAFVYEMTLKCLLLPGADGVPTWHPENTGEKMMCKLPIQFRELFKEPARLSEEIGQKLAEWASGATEKPTDAQTDQEATPKTEVPRLLKAYAEAASFDAWDALEKDRGKLWPRINQPTQKALKDAATAARERLELNAVEQQHESDPVEPEPTTI